jgi:hypothetical protein
VIAHLGRNHRLATTDMEIHFRNRTIGFGRGVEDVKGPVVPSTTYRTALDRVAPLAGDPPTSPRETCARQSIYGVQQPVVARRPAHRHGLKINLGVESIDDPQHVFRPVLINEVNRAFPGQLRMAGVEPCPDLIRAIIFTQPTDDEI